MMILSVKWLTHPSRFAPLKVRQTGTRTGTGTKVPEPRREHGTETSISWVRICLRDGSCGSGHHPRDHDAQFGCTLAKMPQKHKHRKKRAQSKHYQFKRFTTVRLGFLSHGYLKQGYIKIEGVGPVQATP